MKSIRAVVCGLLFLLIAGLTSARASTFAYAFSGSSVNGTIVLTATLVSPGEYQITNVTGFTDGLAITSILGAGVYPTGTGLPPNDNLLFPTSGTGVFDEGGLSYVLAGGTDFNIYSYPVANGYDYAIGGSGGGLITSFAITATPEPGSLILVATGALGAFGLARRRWMR